MHNKLRTRERFEVEAGDVLHGPIGRVYHRMADSEGVKPPVGPLIPVKICVKLVTNNIRLEQEGGIWFDAKAVG